MKVFVIAGEASGDALGAALMAGLRQLRPDVTFDGVGGSLMQAQGLASRFAMDELSVMGLAEILPRYRALRRRIRQMADAVLATRPDVLITIDSPDFCLRVAALVRAGSAIRTIHYVAPSVWAWRPGRAAKMARHIDHVLALLPFEPPYMTAAGMTCDFVGHPVVAEPVVSREDTLIFRAGALVRDGGPMILALPGSRRSEVTRLLPVFGAALASVRATHPNAKVVIPTTENVGLLVTEMTRDWPFRPIIMTPPHDTDAAQFRKQKRTAFAAADVALAASGTVSLELAAAGTPMVIAYDMAWLSRQIISRMLRVDTVTLVNLISETRVVPEFIGRNCRPGPIAAALERVLADPAAQTAALDLTMQRLGRGGEAPGLRAARSVLAAM